MVATASGEKLLIRRRPVKNWTQLHWQSMIQMVTPYACFCAEITFVLKENQQKLLPPELHFLTPICTKSRGVYAI